MFVDSQRLIKRFIKKIVCVCVCILYKSEFGLVKKVKVTFKYTFALNTNPLFYTLTDMAAACTLFPTFFRHSVSGNFLIISR